MHTPAQFAPASPAARRRIVGSLIALTVALGAIGLAGSAAASISTDTSTATPSATAAHSVTAAHSAQAKAARTVKASGTATWGFKERFRWYVAGQIGSTKKLAKGKRIVLGKPAKFASKATTARKGQSDTRAYRFPVSTAKVTSKKNLTVATRGSVRYRVGGHLDVRLANVKVVVKNGKASVVADVYAKYFVNFGSWKKGSRTSKKVVFATASTTKVTTKKGKTTVSAKNLKLTKAGERALRGMYQRGEVLDDLTVAWKTK